MKVSATIVAIAIASFAFLFPSPALPPAPSVAPPDFSTLASGVVIATHTNAMVTIETDGERKDFKLAGIQAPSVAPGSTALRVALAGMVEGESVWYNPDGQAAHIYRQPDGLYVNLEVVRVGRGDVAAAGLSEERRTAFTTYRDRAKGRKVGMWVEAGTTAPAAPTGQPTAPANQITPAASPASAEQVCVTKSGTKYHRCTCRHASKSGAPVTVEEAKKRGLSPCSVCKPPS